MSFGRVATLLRQVNALLENNDIDFIAEGSYLQLLDYLQTYSGLMRIIARYEVSLNKNDFVKECIELLRERSERVLNKSICYTINRDYVINKICIAVAKYCDSENWLTLLLPTVDNEDIFGNQLCNLKLGQFILADNKQQFIAIREFTETAIAGMEKMEGDCYVTVDESNKMRLLSDAEVVRLGDVSLILETIRTTYTRKMNDSEQSNTLKDLMDELKRLRAGLKEGDVSKNGKYEKASVHADFAIVRFREYFDKLPLYHQDELRNVGKGYSNLGDILSRLFRKHNEPVSCIQEVGFDLDRCIANNGATILSLSVSQQEFIEASKVRLKAKIDDQSLVFCGDATQPSSEQLIQAATICAAKQGNQFDQYREVLLLLLQFIVNYKEPYAEIFARICYEIAIVDWRAVEDRFMGYQNIFQQISVISGKHFQTHLWNQFIADKDLLSKYGFSTSRDDYYRDFPRYKSYSLIVKTIESKEAAKEEAEWKEAHPYLDEVWKLGNYTYGFFNTHRSQITGVALGAAVIAGGIYLTMSGSGE